MKKTVIGVILLIVIIGAAYLNNQPKDTSTIKIGYSGVLTGPVAFLGQSYAAGMRAALEEVNANGGINGRQMEIIEEDNFYTGKGGIDAFHALQTKGVNLIMSIGSSPTVPVSPLAKEAGIPLLVSAVFADILTDNPNAIRMGVLPAQDVKATIPDMQKSDVKNVGVIYINNEYGVANLEAFRTEAARAGITIVAEEAFLPGATEFSTPVSKLLTHNMDAVFVIDLSFVSVVDQLKKQTAFQAKPILLFLNASAYASNTVYKNPAVFEGTHMTVPLVSLEGGPERIFFIDALGLEKDTTDALGYQSLGYDNTLAIAEALRKNSDFSKFAETFQSLGEFKGVNGVYTVNSRDIGVPVIPAVFQGGKLVIVQ